MKPKSHSFSFQERAAAKAAARAKDEEQLRSGKVSPAVMARINGGSLRGGRYNGPSERIQALARETTLGELLTDLHLTARELADVLGVTQQNLDKGLPLSSQALPQRVRDFSKIIAATAIWEGSIPQAFAWFLSRPLPSFSNQTAADLLRLGRADAVKTYLDRIDRGGYT